MQMVQGMSQEYFADSFEGDTHVLRILNVRVSTPAQAQLKTRLEQIAQEYVDQSRADSHLPLHERPPVSVCVAARAWIPKFMHELIRMETLQSGAAPLLNMPPEGRSAEGDTALQTAQKTAVKMRKATAKSSSKPATKTPVKRASKGKVSKRGVKNTGI
jgi:hypothetical protein